MKYFDQNHEVNYMDYILQLENEFLGSVHTEQLRKQK